jgi:hypothetical protein
LFLQRQCCQRSLELRVFFLQIFQLLGLFHLQSAVLFPPPDRRPGSYLLLRLFPRCLPALELSQTGSGRGGSPAIPVNSGSARRASQEHASPAARGAYPASRPRVSREVALPCAEEVQPRFSVSCHG